MTATALIIDDEADIRELIAMTLSRMGLEFHTAANLDEARNLLNTYEFDLCLTDMKLPDGNGVEFVRYIQSTHPDTPVAVITAHGNMEAAVEAMKNGAYDFVSKPVDINQLRKLVTHAVASTSKSKAANDNQNTGIENTTDGATNSELADLSPVPSDLMSSLESLSHQKSLSKHAAIDGSKLDNHHTGTQLIGESEAVHELRGLIDKVSRTNAPIWITGESGTGKELIARLIHERGPRHDKPFVAVNCGAIPANLMESELFGHKKGSFTGATNDHDGLFMQADGGTLFLDEVAELPLHMQVKLLRAIQERSIRPVGGQQESTVDVRILSASHIDLAEEVDAGRFRHDLYYRLNVISLRSPSLRDRPGDIPLLVNYLLNKLRLNVSQQQIQIDEAALDKLCNYAFPGNVRELENILERATTMMEHDLIQLDDIHLPNQDCSHPSSNTTSKLANRSKSNTKIEQSDANDRERIINALNETRWNRKAAAENLGLTYRQLRYRIQQLGIDKAS